jgi:hypothetical protein
MSLLNDPVFWVSISGLVIGAYKFSLTQIYKSKCSDFKLCFGCINVKRDVQIEAHIDERAFDAGQEEVKEGDHNV